MASSKREIDIATVSRMFPIGIHIRLAAWIFFGCLLGSSAVGEQPVHERIDQWIESASPTAVAPVADDPEFLRRVYLDLAGRVPSVEEARRFLNDVSIDKRTVLIDQLLASPDYARRMSEAWNVQLMERAGENPEWAKYLESSFSSNKPWDKLVREILNPDPADEATRGSAFFLTKRLENYGQQPVDVPGLTRDVGRLFLGIDLQCAQCHDHLFVEDYKQIDFQGLHSFVSHLIVRSDVKFPAVAEKVVDKKTEFMSVFAKQARATGPRLPFGSEFDVPVFAKGEEFSVAPDRKANIPGKPKFSPLTILAEQLPSASNSLFVQNIVNRLWCQMLGRGLIQPLDLAHSGNPPTHPQIMNLLIREFVEHHFDMKWLLRELALTQTYQRSSRLPSGLNLEPRPESYLVAIEKPLSTEQFLWSTLQATGTISQYQPISQADGSTKPNPQFTELKKRFTAAFANPPREPEGDFAPSVKAALFLSNDDRVLRLLKPDSGNLADLLAKQENVDALVDRLFLAALTRPATADEAQATIRFLAVHPDQRKQAVGQAIWALISSTEFCMNH